MKTQNLKIISALLMLMNFTVACGQNPLAPGMGFGGSNSSSSGIDPALNVTTIPFALLSSEQVLRSMSSVTDTAINGTLMTEYNSRQSVFATGNDLKLVTSPMLIAVTNLSSVFCNETLTREAALPAAQRRLFSDVNFSSNVRNVSDANFAGVTEKLSRAFWGRGPSSEESQILSTGKNEFVAALTTQEASANSSSRNLMLFTCTAMLSSLDSYQF